MHLLAQTGQSLDLNAILWNKELLRELSEKTDLSANTGALRSMWNSYDMFNRHTAMILFIDTQL